MSKVYLAGPIKGLTYSGATSWRNYLADIFSKHGIVAYSPMRGKGYLKNEESLKCGYEGTLFSSPKRLTIRDKRDCTTCDLMLVNFGLIKDVSIGTCIEIGWANANNIPIIAVMGKDNVHRHAMIEECCIVTESLDEAIKLTIGILKPYIEI